MTSFFASPRERRLWLLALGAVVAIYATLGLTGRLADVLVLEASVLEAAIAAESCLGVPATGRNLNTIFKLRDMVEESS